MKKQEWVLVDALSKEGKPYTYISIRLGEDEIGRYFLKSKMEVEYIRLVVKSDNNK